MPKNSRSQQIMEESLGAINAAQTILEKFPDIFSNNFTLSVETNPIDFIMRILYQTVGYDKIIGFVAKVLTGLLDGIEMAVKTYMLTQLKYIFSCTLNPFITYDLLKEGVVFDLKTVDVINMLYYSPLDKSVDNKKRNGKWYYFGCEDFEFPDQLECASDFNALLWYMKNRTVGSRTVWYGYKKQHDAMNMPSLNQKQRKTDGIITLEYSGRSSGVRDAEGHGMNLQTPYNNCIHVFIGNTKPISGFGGEVSADDIMRLKSLQSEFMELRENASGIKSELDEFVNNLKNSGLSKEERKSLSAIYKNYSGYMDLIVKAIDKNQPLSEALQTLFDQGVVTKDAENGVYKLTVEPIHQTVVINNDVYNGTNGEIIEGKKEVYDAILANQAQEYFRPVEYNYYYHKTLFQFNADYVFSLKLFDGKTMTARLIDALSGCLTMGVDLSVEERMIQNEVNKIVHDIVETDTAVVSDCFFSFSNEEYDELLQRSENQRLGLYVSPDGAVGAPIDAETIMRQLNELAPNATQEQLKTAIEGTLNELSRYITPEYNGETNNEINYNLQANFINNLLQTLANVLVMTVLSPKLYLLMAVNLKIMGRETNFDLATFIESFRQLIVGIVRTIRDEILRLFKEWVMEIISDLAKEVGAKLIVEQIAYYRALLKSCIECFRLNRHLLGWNMADVDYADIYNNEEETEPVTEEC